jgi:tRNA isopentenyl-2-thiomethyl-A-37 hydroxylase MiaE
MLGQLIEKALVYAYSVIVLQDLTDIKTLNNVRLIPRTIIDYRNNPQPAKSKSLKVLVARAPEELKLSNQVLRVLSAIEVGGKLLTDARYRKNYVKLVNVRKPEDIAEAAIEERMLP